MSNLKIGTRLVLGFGCVAAMLAMVVSIGVNRLSEVGDLTGQVARKDLVEVDMAYEAMARNRSNLALLEEMALSEDAREREAARQEMLEHRRRIIELVEKLSSMITSAEGRALLEQVMAARPLFVRASDQMVAALQAGHRDEALRVLRSELRPAMAGYQKPLQALVAWQVLLAQKDADHALQQVQSGRGLLLGLGLLALLVALGSAVLVTRSITRPLAEALGVAEQLASGDLTVQMPAAGGDEVGLVLRALASMVERLAQVVGSVRSVGDALTRVGDEVERTAQSISQSATEQAASVTQTSASVEQISASLQKSASNAHETDKIATSAATDATAGGVAVRETVQAMQDIAKKINIVDEIAYQTNLLALNAAIEAARAGDHGKGFAVVAEEVGKLAARSQTAAREISEVASSSVKKAEQAGQMLHSMVPGIRKTSELVQEIAAGTQEQSQAVGQVNTAMGQLSLVMQQGAQAAETLAATAQEMNQQAGKLHEALAFFRM